MILKPSSAILTGFSNYRKLGDVVLRLMRGPPPAKEEETEEQEELFKAPVPAIAPAPKAEEP